MTCILDRKFTLSEDVLKRPFPFGHEKLCDYAPSTQTTLRDLPYSPKKWLAFLFSCDILETRHKQELCCLYAEYLAIEIHMDTDPWLVFAIELKRRWFNGDCRYPEADYASHTLRKELRRLSSDVHLEALSLTEREEKAYWEGVVSPVCPIKAREARLRAQVLTRASSVFVKVLQLNPSPWQIAWVSAWALEGLRKLPWIDLHQLTFRYLENIHD